MKQSAKRLLSMVLVLVMVLSMLPVTAMAVGGTETAAATPAAASASDDTITNEFGFNISVPDGFDSDTTHPYGNGATTVNLSPVKEIGVFESSANVWHSRVYNFTEDTMLGTDPNKNLFSSSSQCWIQDSVLVGHTHFFHPSTAMTTQMMAASSPLESASGTSLDASGNGRDNLVAYYGRNRTSGQLQLYVYTADRAGNHDTVQGASWTGSGKSSYSWMSETTPYNNEGYLSIVSGDFDGDGKDTMVLYDPAAGNLLLREFKVTDETHGTVSQVVSYALGSRPFLKDKFGKTPNAIQKMSGSTAKARNTAMVQMTVGDVDRDYKDELIVTVSLTNMLDEKGGISNRSSVLMVLDKNENNQYFTCNWAQQLKDVYDQDKVSPCTDTGGWLMRAASSAVGDIDGDGFPEILTVGVGSDDNADDDNFCNDGYFAVITEYNKGYSIAATTGKDDKPAMKGYYIPQKSNNKSLVGTESSDLLCMSPVSLGLVRFDGTGTIPYAVIRGTIFQYADDDFTAAKTNQNNLDDMFYLRKIIRQPIVGNFDGNIEGREQIFFALSSGKMSGNFYDVEIGGWYYNGSGSDSVMNGGGLRSSRWQAAVSNVSEVVLTAPDADTNDGYIARYKEKEYTCVDPEVMAILEATPYFEDLKGDYDETRGSTSFGKGKGSGSGSSVQGSTRAGAYVSYEQDISIFGIKIGSMEAEYASMLEWAWGVEKETSFSYDMNFDAGRDSNQVVLICTPVTIYHYEAYDVETKTWKPMDITLADTPAYRMMSVEEYNAVAELLNDSGNSGKYPIIGSDIVSAVPGQPDTYRTSASGLKNVYVPNDWVSVGHGSSIISQSVTNETSHTFSNELMHSIDVKGGIGAGGFVVGLQGGFSIGGGWSTTNTSSLTRSGTVADVPEGYDDYSFKWKFITWDATLGTGDQQYTVPVLGYLVTGVKQPPSMPQNVQIDPGTDSVTLTWESGFNTAAYYEVCRYVPNDPTGKYYYVRGTVSGSDAKDGVYTFTDTGLQPGTQYQYTLRAVSLESTGAELYSNYTEPMSIVTASTAGTPKIVIQTKGVVNIVPGASTAFNVIATPAISSNSLTYQWQSRGAGETAWKNMTDKEQYKLTVTGTAALDGTSYRCMVVELTSGTLPVFIYSEPVTLKVGKADSTATLSVLDSSSKPTTSGSADHSEETPGDSYQQTVVNRYEIKVGTSDTATTYEAYAAGGTYVYRNVADGKYYRLNNLQEVALKDGETSVYTGKADSADELTALSGYLADGSTIITNVNALHGTVQETAAFDADGKEVSADAADAVLYNVFTATGVAVQGTDPDLQQSTLTLYQKANDSTDTNYYVAFYETQADETQVLKLDSTALTEKEGSSYPNDSNTGETTYTNFTYLSGTLQESWTTTTQSITIGSESKECEVCTDGSVTVYKYTKYGTIQVPVYDENGQETGTTEEVTVVTAETYYHGATTGEGETETVTYTALTPFAQGQYGVISADKTVSGTVTPGAVQTTTIDVPTTVMKQVGGDPVTLKVNVSATGASTSGTVTFQITNTTTGVATTRTAAVSRYGTASVSWTPSTEGVYTIRAVYGGSTTAAAAASDTITYYATAGSNTLYDIQLPAAPQYGDTITPSLVKWTEGSSTENVTGATFTYHKYLGTGATGTDSRGYEVTGTTVPKGGISNLLPGAYLIKTNVEKDGVTSTISKALTVSKRGITVTVPNFTVSTGEAATIDWAKRLKTIRVTNSDGTECTLDAVYGTAADGYSSLFTLEGNSLPATAGNYDVAVGYTNDTIQSDFLSKYTPTINRSVVTVTTSSYTVTYTAGANGTMTANNISAGSQGFATGASIKKNSKLHFTAAPDDGFQVSKWTVKDVTTGKELTTGFTVGTNTLTLNALSCDLDVTVEFSNQIHKVTFGPDAAGNGKVVATQYDTTLVSGDNVVGGSSVTFTAMPASGYVVKQWSVAKNNGTPAVQRNPDGVTAYTGTTLTLDNIDADTTVTVTFEEAGDPFQVTYSAVERNAAGTDYEPADDVVSFTADGLIGGTAVKGSTVKLTATVTPGTAIQEWQISTDNGTNWTNVAGSVKEYTIYSLQADTQIRVLVTTGAASYPVTFSMVDGSGAAASGAGTLTAANYGGNITSGTSCMSYTTVVFTYTESENYELVRWNVTGTMGTEATDASNRKVHTYTIDSLDANTEVKAVVRKKPQISITQPTNGTITVTGTIEGVEKTIESSKWVDCGTEITVTVTPAANYVVTGITAMTSGGSVAAIDTSNATAKASGAQKLTFTPTENVTISATFLAKPIVTVGTVTGGTVNVTGTKDGTADAAITSGSYVDFGSSLNVVLKPEKGYEVGAIDGRILTYTDGSGTTTDNMTYTILDVRDDQSITPIWTRIETRTANYAVVDQDNDGTGDYGTLIASVTRKGMAAYDEVDVEGVTSGSKTVYAGGELTLTAAEQSGYRVKQWTINGVIYQQDNTTFTGNNLTLPYADITGEITVQFELCNAKIHFTDPQYGTLSAKAAGVDFTSGGSSVAPVVFTVRPDTNYEIKQWTVNGVGVVDETTGEPITDETYTYQPDGADATIAVELQGVELTITASAGTGGTASVLPQTVRYGDTVTLTADSNTGYEFEGWYLNETKVSEDATYTFTALENASYTANFSIISNNVVTYSVNDSSMGSITATADGSSFTSETALQGGMTVVFTVNATEGYRVKAWTGLPADAVISEDLSTATVILGSSLTVQAELEAIPTYTITLHPTTHGTITAQVNGENVTEVLEGTQVTFTATADPNWMFSKWTDDAEAQTASIFTAAVTKDMEVGVEFAEAVHYTVMYQAIDANGTVSGTADGTALSADTEVQRVGGSMLAFTAAPGDGYMVKAWTINGIVQKNLSNTLTIDCLTQNTTVTVEFEPLRLFSIPSNGDGYTITEIGKTPADYGNSDQIRKGGDVTFKVVPDDGRIIESLTPSIGTAVSNDDGSYTVTVTNVQEDIQLDVEVYSVIPLLIRCGENGTLTVTWNGVTQTDGALLIVGSDLTITAAGNSGYRLSELTVNGVTINSGGTYTVTGSEAGGAVTVEAVFEKEEYTIYFDANGGSVSPEYAVTVNGRLTNLPTPAHDTNYTFDGWFTAAEGGSKVTADTVFTQNATIYAHWTNNGGGTGSGDADLYNVNVCKTVHGTVTARPDSAASGESVMLVVAPDEGYRLAYLTATDSEGNKLTLTNRGDGSFVFTMPDSMVNVKASFIETGCVGSSDCPSRAFTDLNTGKWYHEAVDYVLTTGMMNGMGKGRFAPDGTLTRAMLVQILYNKEGRPEVTGSSVFADVSNTAWYADAVIWAAENGYVTGYNDVKFGPEDPMTREQLAAILWRYAGSPAASGRLNFTDAGNVSEYAREALLWATTNGVMNGKGNGILDPKGKATRVEAAQMLMNYIENIEHIQ